MAYFKTRAEDIEATNQLITDLVDKSEAAAKVASVIDSFVSGSKIKVEGDVYDAFRANLSVYKDEYKKLSQLSIVLADHIDVANSGFLPYINEGVVEDPVDMKYISIYEAKISENKRLIYQLKQIPSVNTDGEPNEPDYSNAQAEIARLEAENVELQNKIDYLKRLPGEDDKASNKVEDIKVEIEKYVSEIESMQVSNI